MSHIEDKTELSTELIAKKIRILSLKMTSSGKSSHIGSIFSIADILAVLYNDFLNFDPNNCRKKDRDRFILSKGHAGAGVYSVLALKGFFPIENLKNHYQNGSLYSGHISHKGINGVEFSTGSLGHGLPVAVGLSIAAKINCAKYKIICLMSDGECDEGSNWESILLASHHNLDNLIVIIDKNNLQSIKTTSETLNLEPFIDKWNSFGWDTINIDGHDYQEIKNALNKETIKKPLCIIANTIKGKGVKFMENNILWHYRSAQGEEYIKALNELNRS